MAKTRRLIDIVDGKLPEKVCYCRKCTDVKPEVEFSKATDLFLDTNGRMSLCKDCVNLIYEEYLSSEKTIEKAVFKICKLLNVRYDPRAIESALKQMQTKESDPTKVFPLYRAKLLLLLRENVNDTNVDLTFQENIIQSNKPIEFDEDIFNKEVDIEDRRMFWGKDFSAEEISLLEHKLANWSSGQEIESPGERNLLKYICLKELEIDKTKGNIPSGLLKDYNDLLKVSGYAPRDVTAANSGKSKDTFGTWLKEISSMRPEEWVEDKSIYKDVDNIEAYGEKHLTSPMRQLVTGSREFFIEESETVDTND